jgi:hypothetical protein
MNEILEKNLLKKYPKILKDMYGPMDKTCMHFGIECGAGWYYLLDNLMHSIQQWIDFQKVDQVVAEQIKEKFGTLRFYYSGGDERIAGMVELAELMSGRICENCGSMDEKVGRTQQGWMQTLCALCACNYNKKIKFSKDSKMWTRVYESRTDPYRAWTGIDEITPKKKGKK